MTNTSNSTQKAIIKELTSSHPNAAAVYKKLLNQAQSKEQAEQIARIMQALKIKSELPGYNIETNNKTALRLEIDASAKKLYFIRLDDKGNTERRDSVTEGEAVMLYNWIIYQRDNGNGNFNF